MNNSQVSLAIRQRGAAIAGGGFLVQFIGLVTLARGTFVMIGLLLILAAGAATAGAFTQLKRKYTEYSANLSYVTGVVGVIGAFNSGWSFGGFIALALGTGAIALGNSQLASGIGR